MLRLWSLAGRADCVARNMALLTELFTSTPHPLHRVKVAYKVQPTDADKNVQCR